MAGVVPSLYFFACFHLPLRHWLATYMDVRRFRSQAVVDVPVAAGTAPHEATTTDDAGRRQTGWIAAKLSRSSWSPNDVAAAAWSCLIATLAYLGIGSFTREPLAHWWITWHSSDPKQVKKATNDEPWAISSGHLQWFRIIVQGQSWASFPSSLVDLLSVQEVADYSG